MRAINVTYWEHEFHYDIDVNSAYDCFHMHVQSAQIMI
jgi:hypothetical protein